MTLKVESPGVYTSQGVPISVTGIAQVGLNCLFLYLHSYKCAYELLPVKFLSW